MGLQIVRKALIHSLWLGCGVLLLGCNSNALYNHFHSLPSTGWSKDSIAYFVVPVCDTIVQYNVIVTLRHQSSYPYQNFWMFIDEKSPKGVVSKDTVECYLADDRGKWLGSGFSVYSMPVLIAHNKRFKSRGNYIFTIRQGMRDDVLPGIDAIGLEIDK